MVRSSIIKDSFLEFLWTRIYIYIYTHINIYMCVCVCAYIIFKRTLTGLNSEIGCNAKVKEPSLPYSLPIAGGRIVGFIYFPMVLALCEI